MTNPRAFSFGRALAGATLTAALIGLAGCGAMSAQNPNSALKPVNAVEIPPDARVMLNGADVVAYFADGRFEQGLPQFSALYEGVNFHFASAEHQARFEQTPEAFLPQFGGYCANGLVYGIPWGGDANTWKMIDGKLYIFGGQGSKDGFELDEAGNLALAEKYWNEEVKGGNSFWQRAKRMVFRVPHYKSGEELAEAVAAAKAKQ
jgi:YHS domain-containing protein